MREDRDCAVAAVATACGVSYEKAHKALWHWNLPFFLESPLLSNPLNVQRGIAALGYKVRNVKVSELLRCEPKVGAVICLMHDPSSAIAGTINQHWVVWFGKDDTGYLFHWGQSQALRKHNEQDTVNMLITGWPNAIYEVVDD